ncbi:MAG: hypothetical protein WCI27_09030 [Candidatus Omnitrophota bacterium]
MNKTMAIIIGGVVLMGLCIWFCPCRKSVRPICPENKMDCMHCSKSGDMPPMGHMRDFGRKDFQEKEVLLTPDGGLFVVAGNKIMKYDQGLNLIKSVEIVSEIEATRNIQTGMKKGCPMMKGATSSDNGVRPGLISEKR